MEDFRESIHPIFRKISTYCWKVLCQLRTDYDIWYWQLYFGSKLWNVWRYQRGNKNP